MTGTAIYSYSPNMVEAAAFSGIDFVRIDSEHAWRRDESMEHMIRAALLAGVTPIVRIDRDDAYLPRKAFEIGAGGIVVPNVCTADDASRIVEDARFPPLGRRGLGSLCLSGEWGNRKTREWVEWSNGEPLVGIMIEHVDALENLDAIMAVPGIDFVLFGPGDFGVSLRSWDADYIESETRKALAQTVASARSNGKHVMFGVGMDDAAVEHHVSSGIDMLEFSHDVVIFRQALEAKVRRFAEARR
ncbi:HpcH/HpaI aldolase family protein [Aureimonas altamirensis]|uniref:HpcH/HpaI aldolase family protein n=1 Tax=Aureimonas altamirensis TaxID=370622 RepID=UPI00255412D4|nr:aldolase/citrate lyase family protein [Aureimonas altamirensis]